MVNLFQEEAVLQLEGYEIKPTARTSYTIHSNIMLIKLLNLLSVSSNLMWKSNQLALSPHLRPFQSLEPQI